MNWGLIGAFVVGSLFGVVLMAQFAAKGQGDRCAECYWKRLASELRDTEMATLATEEASDG